MTQQQQATDAMATRKRLTRTTRPKAPRPVRRYRDQCKPQAGTCGSLPKDRGTQLQFHYDPVPDSDRASGLVATLVLGVCTCWALYALVPLVGNWALATWATAALRSGVSDVLTSLTP